MTAIQLTDGVFDGLKLRREIAEKTTVTDHLARFPFRNTKPFTPFNDTQGNTLYSDQTIISLIAILLCCGRPPAVGFFVIPIVVWKPVNAVLFGRSWPHVSEKIFKLFPSLTDCNTSPAIARIAWVVRVKTASAHAEPDIMFICVASIMRPPMSVSGKNSLCLLKPEATTAKCRSADVGGGYGRFVAAIA